MVDTKFKAKTPNMRKRSRPDAANEEVGEAEGEKHQEVP